MSMSAQGVPVSLCGLSPGADREFLSGIRKSRFCSAAAAQNINLSWTTSRAQRWDGCSLIVHTRYVPAPEGARLEERDHWPETTPDCYAAFECRVVNTMDTGYSTHFLGDVLETHLKAKGPVLTAAHFRAHMPQAWQEAWMQNYRRAQEEIERGAEIKDIRWERARTGK